jgi:hypothetical protein
MPATPRREPRTGTRGDDLTGRARRRDFERPFTEELVEAHDRATLVRQAILALPTGLRAPLVLRYYAGLSEREIATAIRRRPGTVKSRLHEARRLLANDSRLAGLALAISGNDGHRGGEMITDEELAGLIAEAARDDSRAGGGRSDLGCSSPEPRAVSRRSPMALVRVRSRGLASKPSEPRRRSRSWSP